MKNKSNIILDENSQAGWMNLFKAIPDAVVVTHMENGKIIKANPACFNVFGYKPEDMIGKTSVELGIFQTANQREELIKGLIESDFFIEMMFYDSQRNSKCGLFSGKKVIVENQNSFLIIARDISSQKEADRKIKESEEQYHTLIDTISDVVLSLDKNGIILNTNPAVEEMFGLTAEEVIGTNIISLISIRDSNDESEFIEKIYWDSKKLGDIVQLTAIHKNSQHFPVELVLNEMEISGEKLLNCVVRDITERKKMDILKNAKIAAERANKEKSEFLANVSHELRTPMHAILSFVNMSLKNLRKETPNLEKVEKHLQNTTVSGNRLKELLENLLDYTKLENNSKSLNLSDHDLINIIQNSIKHFEEKLLEKSIVARLDTDEPMILLSLDVQKIDSAVKNYLDNAIKYSPSNTAITISLKRKLEVDSEVIEFCIADQGIGVPDDETTTIFNPFTQSSKSTTGAGGTGLGLAMNREIIKSHNGKTWVEKNADEGASFFFTLPLKQ